MHIAFLTPEYPHKKTGKAAGIGSYIKNLATSLSFNQIKVSVFVYGQDKNEEFLDGTINIYKIQQQKHSFLSWYFNKKNIQKRVNKIIVAKNIAIIEAPDWTGITAFIKFKCPLIIRLHGSDTYFCHLENRKQKQKNFWFEKLALKRADYIVSVSEFTSHLTKKLFGIKKEIEVIHNGIDTTSFSPSKNNEIPNTILYFGAVIRKKGVLELASILNKVVEVSPTVKPIILGKDVIDSFEKVSTKQLLLRRLSDKVKMNIVFKEEIPYKDVKHEIEKASVVVLPSFAEAFPMTWLEAMAMEKALVTSNIGWANELMIHNKTGFICNPTKHDEFAGYIVDLLNNEEKRNEFGKNARKRIEDHFSQEVIVEKNIKYFKNIVNASIKGV